MVLFEAIVLGYLYTSSVGLVKEDDNYGPWMSHSSAMLGKVYDELM